jgi:hypothetical protein
VSHPVTWSVQLELKKFDDAERVVTGWVGVVTGNDGVPIIDADGHQIPATELEKAVWKATGQSDGKGKVGDLHERTGIGDVLETFVVTAAKREAFKGDLGDSGKEGWISSFKIHDDKAWQQIKNGERPQLSLEGTGKGRRLTKSASGDGKEGPLLITDIELNKASWFSLVDRGASGDAEHRPEIVLWKRAEKSSVLARLVKAFANLRKQEPTMTLEEVLAKLTPDEQSVILAALQEKAAPAPAPAPAPVAPAPNPEPKPEDMAKRDDVPEDVKIAMAKRDKEIEDAKAEQVALQKRVAKMEDDALTVSIQKRLDSDMAFVPGDKAELLGLIKRSRAKLDDKDAEQLEALLVKVSTALKTSPLLKRMGVSDAIDGPEATVQIEKRAEELRKADPKLSKEAARVRAMEDDPDAYAAALAEQRGQ